MKLLNVRFYIFAKDLSCKFSLHIEDYRRDNPNKQ